MERPVGVSIISFFPEFFLPNGHKSINERLEGLTVQLLPLRGLNLTDIQRYQVLSFEGPWNTGSVLDALRRTVGLRDDEYPSLIDILLFGSGDVNTTKKVAFIAVAHPQALPIDIPWLPNSAIELSHNMYKGNARVWGDRKPNGVVLDTYHWQNFKPGEAEKLLDKFGGQSAIRMVHVKLMNPQETDLFYRGKGNNAYLLRQFLAHDKSGVIPVVIEANRGALKLPGFTEHALLKRLALTVRSIT